MAARAASSTTPITEPREQSEDFSLPWCKSLIADSTFPAVPMISRNRKNLSTTEDSLMADTLWTGSTIRACQAFYRPPISVTIEEEKTASSDRESLITDESRRGEVRLLFSLGSGMNGHANIAHGGIVMLLLDEVVGLLAALMHKRFIMTAELTVTFKKPVPTPSVLLCRAWLPKPSAGRKVWVEGTVEDGNGGVFATCRGLTVLLRSMERL